MKKCHIETIVDKILARKKHEELGIQHDNSVLKARRGILPKPPPPSLCIKKKKSTVQRYEITKMEEQSGDWEGPINWDNPIEWKPDDSSVGKESKHGGGDEAQSDHPDRQEEEYPQEDQFGEEKPEDQNPAQDSNEEQWAIQEHWDEQGDEALQTPEMDNQWDHNQTWHEEEWYNQQQQDQYDQDENVAGWQEQPVPAPTITPVKGVKPAKRPQFAPLYAGKSGGGGKMGYPTPLTHPTPPRASRGGIIHPIHDPKLASFFAMHEAGRKRKGGWQPPLPPIPTMNKQHRERTIPYGTQMALPMVPKASAPAYPKKRRWVPESAVEHESVLQDNRKTVPERRQMLVKLDSGKLVVAEYWDI